MKEILCIVNPAAASGSTARRWRDEVAPRLERAGASYDVVHTSAPGEAIALAAARAADYSVVCSVGGDGTCNEVLNGLLRSGASACLGAIPLGSGDDIPTAFGIPEKDLDAAVQCLLHGEERRFDLGYCESSARYFAGAASMGFDAEVVVRTAEAAARGRRKNYNLAVFTTLMKFAPYRLRVQIDDAPPSDGERMLLAIGNGKRYGGGMHVCPEAEPDDGRFAVVGLRRLSRLGLLAVFPKVFAGKHLAHPQVESYAGVRVRAESLDRPCRYQVDGEVMGYLPESFVTRPGILRVRVPRPYVPYAEIWRRRRR